MVFSVLLIFVRYRAADPLNHPLGTISMGSRWYRLPPLGNLHAQERPFHYLTLRRQARKLLRFTVHAFSAILARGGFQARFL